MYKVKVIPEDIYHQIEKNPFVFYEYVQEEYDNDVYDYWLARNDFIKDKCSGDAFDYTDIEVALAIIQLPGKICREGEYEVNLRPISTKSIKDISALLKCCISQQTNTGILPLDKDISYKELLWFLYHCDWSPYLLTKALELLEENELKIIFHYFNQICFCLAPEKQYKIDNICGQFGIKYILFKPDYIKKAYDTIFPKTILPKASYDKSRLGLFDLVSAINGDSWFWSNYEMSFANIGMMPPVSYDPSRLIGVDSPLINIARWINNSDTQFTYNELIWTFWLYSPTYQITILHKYFSDVSNNQTKFDINLFKKLYNNDYIHLGTFWRYLYEPFKSNDNKIKELLKSILNLSFLAGNNISITEEQVRCILNIINEETL